MFCNTTFTQSGVGRNAYACEAVECRSKVTYGVSTYQRKTRTCQCEVCGVTFTKVGSGPAPRICDAIECRRRRHREYPSQQKLRKPIRSCMYCGTLCVGGTAGRKVCSKECSDRRARASVNFFRRTVRMFRPCVICGTQFDQRPFAKTCSTRCAKDLSNRREQTYRKLNPIRRAKRREIARRYHVKTRELERINRGQRPCIICQTMFWPVHGTKVCSQACHKIRIRLYNEKYRGKSQHRERYCSCGAPLGPYKQFCDRCLHEKRHNYAQSPRGKEVARAARIKRRLKQQTELTAAFELGLIDSPTVRRKKKDIIYRALQEMGLISQGRRKEND